LLALHLLGQHTKRSIKNVKGKIISSLAEPGDFSRKDTPNPLWRHPQNGIVAGCDEKEGDKKPRSVSVKKPKECGNIKENGLGAECRHRLIWHGENFRLNLLG